LGGQFRAILGGQFERRIHFKIRLDRINQTYTISQIMPYQFLEEMSFHLIDKNFYIKFYDKKHRRTVEMLNLELINRQ
jgi:hypothetical protein